ncbi:MAG: hypothetical protein ACXWNL_19860 [Vulcanimicrobiaceae bacterium]
MRIAIVTGALAGSTQSASSAVGINRASLSMQECLDVRGTQPAGKRFCVSAAVSPI